MDKQNSNYAKSHILLWNANGLANKLNDFKNYIYNKSPQIICINETHLKEKHNPRLINYIMLRKDRGDGYGGLAIFYHKSLAVRAHQLNLFNEGEMEAMSIQYNYNDRWSTLILLYNPCKNIKEEEFLHYFNQIEEVGIICGDLNAHHKSWEKQTSRPNTTGVSLFNSLSQSTNLSLLNPSDFKTRLDPHTGKTANIDLFIASNHYQNKELISGPDFGSDHSSIMLQDQNRKKPHLYYRPRWSIKKEKLAEYREYIKNIEESESNSTQEEYKAFTDHITNSAKKFFPLSDNSKPRKPGQPWWTEECEKKIKERKYAKKQFYKHPTPTNRKIYNQKKKEVKDTIKEAKSTSWNTFLSELSPQTPTSKVWKFFKAMKGTAPTSAIPFSNREDNPLKPEESAECLAQHYKTNFSNKVELQQEKLDYINSTLEITSDDDYNKPFEPHELASAIKALKTKSSMGGDMIHNLFLTHLPEKMEHKLLRIFNKIYAEGTVPEEWKQADIVPIQKPGKNPADPAAYRPISLLSCIGKLMERMVRNRLTWYLEENETLLPNQFGFRNGRSTLDPLTILEHEIQMGFRTRQVTIVVTLDLSAAFDRADILSIIYKLCSRGLRGNLLRWLHSYLKDRSYRVWVQNKASTTQNITSSVPQGSPLAPTLFNSLLIDLPRTKAEILFYADDITLYSTAETMEEAKLIMQESVNEIAKWCKDWGQIINPCKSAMTYFTNKREKIGDLLWFVVDLLVNY